jgi:hypothetical protein
LPFACVLVHQACLEHHATGVLIWLSASSADFFICFVHLSLLFLWFCALSRAKSSFRLHLQSVHDQLLFSNSLFHLEEVTENGALVLALDGRIFIFLLSIDQVCLFSFAVGFVLRFALFSLSRLIGIFLLFAFRLSIVP